MASDLHMHAEFRRTLQESGEVEVALRVLRVNGATYLACAQVLLSELGLSLNEIKELLSESPSWSDYYLSADDPDSGTQSSYRYPRSIWNPTVNGSYIKEFQRSRIETGSLEAALQSISRLGAEYLDAILVLQTAMRCTLNDAGVLLSNSTTYRDRHPRI